MKLSVAMSIAGSDSGGGAGIQADLKTFHAFGVFGTTAITAITCQNTLGVSAIQSIDPEIVKGQIRDVLDDFPVRAIKVGMLFTIEIIRAVKSILDEKARSIPLIVDPLMISSTGASLLNEDACEELKLLFTNALLITPNIPEAESLLDCRIESFSQMEEAALQLNKRFKTSVLLKGGHRLKVTPHKDRAVDLFCEDQKIRTFDSPMRDSKHTHGTGCTLSAAITASLSDGASLTEAIQKGKEFVDKAIEHAPQLGRGIGPLNHFYKEG